MSEPTFRGSQNTSPRLWGKKGSKSVIWALIFENSTLFSTCFGKVVEKADCREGVWKFRGQKHPVASEKKRTFRCPKRPSPRHSPWGETRRPGKRVFFWSGPAQTWEVFLDVENWKRFWRPLQPCFGAQRDVFQVARQKRVDNGLFWSVGFEVRSQNIVLERRF